MILAARDEDLPDCATELPVEEEVKPEPVTEPVQEPVEEPASPTKPVSPDPKPTGGKGGRKRPTPPDPNQGVLPLIWTTVKDTLLKFYDESNKE